MMAAFLCALALLSGIIGAGFASGREIVRFFAGHGRAAFASVAMALAMLYALLTRLPSQMAQCGAKSLAALCLSRFGRRLGLLCSALFFLLFAITGGAMLSACAELGALVFPVRHAYGMTLLITLLLCAMLAFSGLCGLALPGALLCTLLPTLLVRLLLLDAGEACFLPAMTPDLPVRAVLDGAAYGALSAAQLCGLLAQLLPLDARTRRQSVTLFVLLFGAMLTLGVLVCRRHLSAILAKPLPFVFLSRDLGAGGYLLLAACMYAAAMSTLCAMLCALMQALPVGRAPGACLSSLICLLFSLLGFGTIISHGYPVLGALCAGLLLVLCLPGCQEERPSRR